MEWQENSKINTMGVFDFQVEKEKIEETKYHNLYILRQAFDDSIFEIQQLTNFLFEEALDDPKIMEEVRSINQQLSKIILSSDFLCEVNYMRKSDLFK